MDSLSLLEAHEVVAMLRAGSVSPLELIDVVERRISATELHRSPVSNAQEKGRSNWKIRPLRLVEDFCMVCQF